MCHDRNDGDEIMLTHEFMAMMIAADRSSVTVSLHVLEGAGMIRSKRGRSRPPRSLFQTVRKLAA